MAPTKKEEAAAQAAGTSVEEVKESKALKGEGYSTAERKWHGEYTIYECNDCPYSSPSEAKVIRHRVDRHSPAAVRSSKLHIPGQ